MSNTVQTPSVAMSGYNNFNVFYALTRQQVGDLLTELNTSTFIDNIQLLFETPIENVVNLRVYPFDVKLHHPVGSAIEDSSVIINVVTMETKVSPLTLYPLLRLTSVKLRYLKTITIFSTTPPTLK